MKNFVQHGERMDLTAPYAVTAGQGALVGAMFGVAITDVANGVVGAFSTEGVYTLPKATGAGTFGSQGTLAYWDNTNRVVTASSSGTTKIGVFAATNVSADTTCRVRLNGAF